MRANETNHSKKMNQCKVCHHQNKLEVINAKELFIGTREVFPYLYCNHCGSLSIKESPPNLQELYSKYPAFDFSQIETRSWRQVLRRYIIFKKNFLARLFLNFFNSWEDLAFKSLHGLNLNRSMSILDVGCGNGILIKTLKYFGFHNLTGIDPHLRQLSEESGFRLLKTNIEYLNEQFDVVMCHHSFEHVEDVYATAKYLDALTKPGGLLIIRIPNIESYSFRKYRESWHGIHAPFHYVLPSFEGMKKIFKNTKFHLQETRQEQIVELFLYNIDYSLNIGLMEPLGVLSCLGDGPIGKKIPPTFTKKEISYWKEKTQAVIKSNIADYIGYYFLKSN